MNREASGIRDGVREVRVVGKKTRTVAIRGHFKLSYVSKPFLDSFIGPVAPQGDGLWSSKVIAEEEQDR